MKCPECAPKELKDPKWEVGKCDDCDKNSVVTETNPLKGFSDLLGIDLEGLDL